MIQYIYAFDIESREEEIFFVFPKFPEIISAVPAEFFRAWAEETIASHVEDAVLTALQSIVLTRDPIPEPDDYRHLKASGFVRLSPLQSMKLELARVFTQSCTSVADFARQIDKHDTAARRLLNLRHRSTADEIGEALASFGKRLVHQWDTEQVDHSLRRELERVLA